MLDARKTFRADDPLRALGIRAQAPAFDDAQREALAGRLLVGDANDLILADLVRGGVPLAVARAELEAAARHPYVKAAAVLKARVAKRDWLLDCRTKLERQVLRAVPRRDRLAPETFFAEHYAPLIPVVLTGLTADWPAMDWSLETLAYKVGNPEIEVQMDREADADFELNSIAHKRRMRWLDVLALLRDEPETNDFYLTANNSGVNRKALDALWRDIGPLPGYLDPGHAGPGRLGDGFFWMGPKGTVTPWHHDLTQNLLMTMEGRKRVTLVSPLETPRMRNHRHCFSRFGADATLEGADIPRLVVDIGPGDILFLPVGWWHHVEGLTRTIGMSFTNFVWPNDFPATYSMDGPL